MATLVATWEEVPKVLGEPDDGTIAQQVHLKNEDETVGIPLCEELLRNPAVIEASFSGFSAENEKNNTSTVRIRVKAGNDPRTAYVTALVNLKTKIQSMVQGFLNASTSSRAGRET
jgi:DNA-directed RNA polymerase subunit L